MEVEIIVKVDGKEVMTKKETIENDEVRYQKISPFARYFSEKSPHWTGDPKYNLMFLIQQEMYANDLLRVKGHLSLGEVYDMLGISRTPSYSLVGWSYNKHSKENKRVDFGIHNKINQSFVNGITKNCLIEPNVDWTI